MAPLTPFLASFLAGLLFFAPAQLLRHRPRPTPIPVGQTGHWRLLFQDEFTGTSYDKAIWHWCQVWWDGPCSLQGNGELELYLEDDVLVENGLLRLRTQQRAAGTWNSQTYNYSSGMVQSGGRFQQTLHPRFQCLYCYVEARLKLPVGQGFWPAFWLLSGDYDGQSKPEIDIMEWLGHDVDTMYMNIHLRYADTTLHSFGSSYSGPDFSAAFHTFAVDWTPQAVIWYVDGVERFRYEDTANIPHVPMYILLNLAVGGSWPGAPDVTTPFPSSFDIDYVRVWQR